MIEIQVNKTYQFTPWFAQVLVYSGVIVEETIVPGEFCPVYIANTINKNISLYEYLT